MDARKELLIKSAARLYSLGIDLDASKDRIRKLVETGVEFSSIEMTRAVDAYLELQKLWDDLEREYLVLRDEIRNTELDAKS